jgi:ankyrin repeat protein
MAKADVSTKNDEGKTALMLAAEGGHDETVKVLTLAGAGK